MNVLDENIPEDQRQLLRSWRNRAYGWKNDPDQVRLVP